MRTTIAECNTLPKVKHNQRVPMGLLQPLPIPKRIWKDLTTDFVERLPNNQGFETIFHFTPLKHPSTNSDATKTFVDRVVKIHGFPKSIVTNKGKFFMSSF